MTGRLAAMAMFAAALGAQQPAPARRVPQPLFSRAYTDALKDILDLEPKDAAELERRLARNPDDFAARLKLIAYGMRADRIGIEQSRSRRAELILWLIEHHPDSEILASPYGELGPADLTPDQLQWAVRLWRAATRARPNDPKVQWNAAAFYRQNDPGEYLVALEKAVALAPDAEPYARALGTFYAEKILAGESALAPRSARELDTTRNAFLLEAAVTFFQNEYNRSRILGQENRRAGELARRYFSKAMALDPGLDQAFVFPQLSPNMIGILAPGAQPPRENNGAQTGPVEIRRLAPGSFSSLPAGIVTALRRRGCTIPQPAVDGPPRNVIRGDFFAAGQPAWAVLCSNGGFSSILVFRTADGGNPEELAKQEDRHSLQSDAQNRMVYSRAIEPAHRKYIVDHYRAYGGPEPPPIDHQGIEDIFIGKASVIHYRYRAKWLQLAGAD